MSLVKTVCVINRPPMYLFLYLYRLNAWLSFDLKKNQDFLIIVFFFLVTSINFTDFALAVKNFVAHLDVKNLVEINFAAKK